MDETKQTNHNQSRHFVIDRTRGRVIFGDGKHGRIPPHGKNNMTAEYPRPNDKNCMPLKQFERNNYFYGKLMTADDFQAEQEYFLNKRRLINRLVHGVGVLCGLKVMKQKESLIKITAGVAIDYNGREIVVPKDVKIDINEKLTKRECEDDAYVWIKYDEYGVKPIAKVSSGNEDEACYSRIRESYQLGVLWVLTKDTANDDQCEQTKSSKGDENQAIMLARVHIRNKKGTLTISKIDVE